MGALSVRFLWWIGIGHAGTLDPFATGVLIVLIGKATKLSQSLMDRPKRYETTIKLGATTATDDLQSAEVLTAEPFEKPTLERIQAAVGKLIGTIMQRPPDYSALKVGATGAT